MPQPDAQPEPRPGRVRVVVGVDGSGRSHRLDQLAEAATAAERLAAPTDPQVVAARLTDAAGTGRLVVVDDVHRLDADSLRALVAAARDGLDVLVSRRPTIDDAALAELDEVLAGRGTIEYLQPLDAAGMAALLTAVLAEPPSQQDVERILKASAGLPAIATAIATAPDGSDRTPLDARVERRLALLDVGTAGLARVLAAGVPVPDDVLAQAAGLALADLPAAARRLADEGLLEPDGVRLVPAVAEAVERRAGPAGRRAVLERIAHALLASGHDSLQVAPVLRAARSRGPIAARVYAAAAEAVRITAPADALSWLDEATDAGGLEDAGADLPVRATRAEASALLGLTPDTVPVAASTPDEVERLRLVEAAVAAHQGRAERCALVLAGAGPVGRLLAVPSLVATGRSAVGGQDADPRLPQALRLLADAAAAAADPQNAIPAFIEAAEAAEDRPVQLVLPDSAHALGALVAVCGGDTSTAERLLTRALTTGVGGPVAVDRHRLLLGWVRMRAGRYDTALAEVRRLASADLAGRDRLVLAALLAGLARRSGDIARLRQAWAAVEPVLARRAVDLFHAEVVEELAVAAARLRQAERIEPVLELMERHVAGLGGPTAWATAVGWTRLQMAVAADDARAAAAAANLIGPANAGSLRQDAQRAAALVWASVVAGMVDEAAVAGCVDSLAAVDLPWEASRLAGQAAITSTEATTARRLLERARELSTPTSAETHRGPESGTGAPGAAASSRVALSDREVEVARLVLEGRTHREIGSQLYLSPKTVEHHVARIRTKLGATSRADLLASLRELLT